MKRILLILAACACACASAGVMSARLGALGRNDTVVTNVTDVTPGNYETVSNRAMTASNYTDAVAGTLRGKGDLAVYSYAPFLIYSYGDETFSPPMRMNYETIRYAGGGNETGWISETQMNGEFQLIYNDLTGVVYLEKSGGEYIVVSGNPITVSSDGKAITQVGATQVDIRRESTGIDFATGNILATTNDISEIESAVDDLRVESALIYRLYSGSNVVAEVTNYNSQVHAPSLRLLQINESNEYVTVWTETNGLSRTLNSAKEYTDDATNALRDVYAPRGWSATTSGMGAEAPSNTTWISTPRTVIAGGLEYAKIVDASGEVWVLTSNGMAAEFNPNTNAYFRITADDGTEVFSIEKTDAQVVGANADGITVSESSVTIPVGVVSAEHPTMYWRTALDSGDWADETNPPAGATVTWTGSAGAWVCTTAWSGERPSSLFFKFTFVQEGSVVIKNNAQTDLSTGIIVNGTRFVPSVSGNNLIWTKQ